eukprot:TRINITY_DN3602_c0_g1_i1.p1 TRINITY_DN3602_c0_g1~~TRINITY_DN3602_c0_g1_i1.p1  ORF type:complete len:179 (+),score=66.48 TRINITY_DN3602_c0_g1_i1:57-539(+)
MEDKDDSVIDELNEMNLGELKIIEDIQTNNNNNIKEFKITTGNTFEKKNSKFQAHFASIESSDDIHKIISQLRQEKKYLNATHNMFAYRLYKKDKDLTIEGCDDDGEFGASERLLFLLRRRDIKNLLVIVTRWYGGIKLGGERFKIICSVAQQLLEEKYK